MHSPSPNSNGYGQHHVAPAPVPVPPPPHGQPTTSNTTGYYPSNNAQQYGAFHLQSGPRVPWSTGLCDCTSNCKLCCITFWCPCITFGQIAEIVDRGSSSCGTSGALYGLIALLTGCACMFSCFYRSKMRHQFMLHDSPCGDCIVHCCCESCALCQEYRELEHRGFNMINGWHANVEQRNHGVAMTPTAPSVEPGMSR